MTRSERYARQSFLGLDAQRVFRSAKIGVIGLGGGGSHINQQLAHIGFQNAVLCDADKAEMSNLNLLVGATLQDVRKKRYKISICCTSSKPSQVSDSEVCMRDLAIDVWRVQGLVLRLHDPDSVGSACGLEALAFVGKIVPEIKDAVSSVETISSLHTLSSAYRPCDSSVYELALHYSSPSPDFVAA